MSPSRAILGSVPILFLMMGTILSSHSQVQPSAAQTANEIKAEESQFYADSHLYLDEQLPKAKKIVHELEGLEPASDQDQLPDLLAKIKYRLYEPTVSPKLTAYAGSPQSPTGPQDNIKAEAAKLYAGARPYMDDPLPELKKTVRELAGLKPAPSQGPLSDLLAKVGAEADELFHKVPNLISDEAVSEAQWPASQELTAPSCADNCFGTGRGSQRDRAFNYLILAHPAQGRQLILSEYRTTRNGKPVLQAAGEPNFQGFVSAWVVFSSPNLVESRFRYLGQQQMGGRSTCVIGFAQIPGSTEWPSRIQAGSDSIPMLLQGIAWVDQSDFRIVRLRTDLLAPQPEIQVRKQTANILFGPVRIAQLDSELWLPQAVNLEMEARGQFFQEQHKYSKYRLYQAKSRIILSPDN